MGIHQNRFFHSPCFHDLTIEVQSSIIQLCKHVVAKFNLVPCSVNLTGERDKVGHGEVTINNAHVIFNPIIDINGKETQELYDKQAQLCCGAHLDPLYDGWYERRCCKGEDEEKFPGEVLEEGQVCCSGRAYTLSGL